MFKSIWKWLIVCWVSAFRLYREQYTYSASALAFTILVSLVPLMSVVLTVVTIFPIFEHFVNLSQQYIFENFLPASSEVIQIYLQKFVEQASKLPISSVIFLMVTAVTLIMTVEDTLNNIWKTSKRKTSWFYVFFHWLILMLSPVFIGFSIFISTYFFSLKWLVSAQHYLSFLPFIYILSLVLNTAMFSALYIIVPNCNVRIRDGIIGGFIAACLFDVAKIGFGYYLKRFNSYEVIYGTMSIIPIFLLWVYICCLIILYGALVVNTKDRLRRKVSLPQHKHLSQH